MGNDLQDRRTANSVLRNLAVVTVAGAAGLLATTLATAETLGPAAAAYADYNEAVETVSLTLPSAKSSIEAAVEELNAYDPFALSRGWLAHAAIEAAREPVFAAHIRRLANEAGGPGAFAETLLADPFSATQTAAAGQALDRAFDVIERDARYHGWLADTLLAIARRDPIAPRPAISSVPAPAPKPSNVRADAESLAPMPQFVNGEPGNPSVIERILTLASLHVLGEADRAERFGDVTNLMTDKSLVGCLTLAKFNTQQCMAAAYDAPEAGFCASEHATGEVGRCFSWILPGR